MVAGNKGRVVTWMDAISQARGWAPYALFFCCLCSTKMQYSFCSQMKSRGCKPLLLPLLRVRSAAAALQARLRAKLRQTVESAGSAAIPSQLMIMATAYRGVKPNTRRLQVVIRKTFEDIFSRF